MPLPWSWLAGHWQPNVRIFLRLHYKQDRPWVSYTCFHWLELHNYKNNNKKPTCFVQQAVALWQLPCFHQLPTQRLGQISQPCSGFPFSFSYVCMCVCMYVDMCKCMHVYERSWSGVILPLLINFEAGSVSQTHRSLAMTISRANFLWEPLPSPAPPQAGIAGGCHSHPACNAFWGSKLWLYVKCPTTEPSPQSLVFS